MKRLLAAFAFVILFSSFRFLVPESALAADQPNAIVVVDDKAYPPFAFLDGAGKPRGITIDIWNLWSRKTGIPVEFRLQDWDDALRDVREGEADVVGGLFRTPEREKDFEFTTKILDIPTAVFFHRQVAGIKGLDDLSGFVVGVVRGDSAEELLRSKYPNIRIVAYAGADALIKDAAEGNLKVFVVDAPVALFFMARDSVIDDFRQTSDILNNLQFSAVRKGNLSLLKTVQAGFDGIASSEINAILSEWSGRPLISRLPWGAIAGSFGALLVLAVGVFIWNVQLRRRIAVATDDISEKNRQLILSNEMLGRSETRFRLIFENAPYPVAISRLDDGRYVNVNNAFLQHTGLTKDEILRPRPVEMGIQFSLDAEAVVEKLRQHGAVRNHELRVRKADGSITYWVCSAVTLEVDGCLHALSMAVDVTEAKQAQEALENSEEKFRTIFNNAPVGIFRSSYSGQLLEANETLARMFGYPTREELLSEVGDLATDIYRDAADRDRLKEALLTHPDGFRMEIDGRRRDGTIVYGAVNASLQKDGNGRPCFIDGTIEDISSLKLTSQALRESERRLSLAIGATADAIWEWDLRTGRTFYSARWYEMLGYSDREFPMDFDTWKGLCHPDDYARTLEAIQQTLAEPRSSGYSAEFRMKSKRGAWVWILGRGNVVERDAQGAPIVVSGTNTDISERKRMEEELRRYHENLEELVRERTAEAEQANRAKSEFLANMSHEIRTPLNAVIGYSQLLQRDPSMGEQQQSALATIARSGEHLLRLINDILDMAKIESGRISLDPEDVDLHVLLRDLESMFGLRAREKGLRLRVEVDPGVPHRVHADGRRLQQVLFNLLSNAVKFTRDGGVTLRAAADTRESARLRFEVEDTGVGISQEERPRMFTPFTQSASGRSVHEGTGLGLAISRRLVELMGGTLSFRSTPGQGSVFGFDIVAPAATTAEMVPSERLQVVRLKPGTRPVRVLVVEDHADSRQVLVRLLAEAGFQVQEAADGLQAIAVWEEFVPELIWMDINLPQLDGCEATQAIKKRAGGRTVIVALTASAFDDDRRRIEACGIDGFLIKPYREAEIFETMGRLLGVEYDYREAAVPVTAGGAAEVVRLDALPPPVRQRLYRTVLELNVEGLRELAGEVGECDPRLRRCVRRAIESLDFSELLAAFDAQGGEHGSC